MGERWDSLKEFFTGKKCKHLIQYDARKSKLKMSVGVEPVTFSIDEFETGIEAIRRASELAKTISDKEYYYCKMSKEAEKKFPDLHKVLFVFRATAVETLSTLRATLIAFQHDTAQQKNLDDAIKNLQLLSKKSTDILMMTLEPSSNSTKTESIITGDSLPLLASARRVIPGQASSINKRKKSSKTTVKKILNNNNKRRDFSNSDKRKIQKITSDLMKISTLKENELNETILVKKFADGFAEKGYDVTFEQKIGRIGISDLVLSKNNEIMVCEIKMTPRRSRVSDVYQLTRFRRSLQRTHPTKKITCYYLTFGKFSSKITQIAESQNVTLIDLSE